MAYTNYNFKTKKALKEAVQKYNDAPNLSIEERIKISVAGEVHCYHPAPYGPDLTNFTGTVYLEGPHYPAAHTWYAQAEMKNGVVVKVK